VPLAFKERNELAGVEPDLARKLAQDLQLSLVLIELPWEELIPALDAGRIDVIMSGMSITEERRRRIEFTDPYLRVGQMALFRTEDAAEMRDPASLAAPASRVGYVRATTGEAYVEGNLKGATRVPFDSIEQGVAALRSDEIDAFVHDAPTIWHIIGGLDSEEEQLTSGYRFLTEEYLAWAVRKRDGDALRERLNRVLASWKSDGRLEWTLDRWIRVRKVIIEPGQ
jgi:polar amino acid transport system substrate-binding protein